MKRFFVTDLDKTLLDDQHGISPANLQALHRLEANHVQVILATGRAYHDVSQHILQRYHLNLPVIALNGAMIVDETGHLLKLHALDLKGLEEALAMLNKADAFYLLYTSSGTYTHEVHSLMANLAELAKTKTNDPQMILQGMQIYYDLLYRYPLFLDLLQTKSCLKLEIVSADEKMRNDLKVGDKITTIGGIVGTVCHITDSRIVIETSSDRVRVELQKWAISTNETAMEAQKELEASQPQKKKGLFGRR